MGPQCSEDFISEPMGVSVVLANVMKHITELLPSPSPPCLVDQNFFAWINNEYTLHTCDTIVSKIVINNHV